MSLYIVLEHTPFLARALDVFNAKIMLPDKMAHGGCGQGCVFSRSSLWFRVWLLWLRRELLRDGHCRYSFGVMASYFYALIFLLNGLCVCCGSALLRTILQQGFVGLRDLALDVDIYKGLTASARGTEGNVFERTYFSDFGHIIWFIVQLFDHAIKPRCDLPTSQHPLLSASASKYDIPPLKPCPTALHI